MEWYWIVLIVLLLIPTVSYYLIERTCGVNSNCTYSDIRCLTKRGRRNYFIEYHREFDTPKNGLYKEILLCWLIAPLALILSISGEI